MTVFETKDKYENINPVAVGLGNFDGVHLGHISLIKKLTEEAKKSNIKSMIYSFKNHPLKVLKNQEPKLIMTEAMKLDEFEKLGVDLVYLERFTEEYGQMTPEEFTEKIIGEKLNGSILVVGEDFTFGRGGAGDARLLKKIGEETGKFRVEIVPLLKIDGKTVSSTEIRRELAKGDPGQYRKYTGRYYMMSGTVIEGRKVGKNLGYPTANIIYDGLLASPSDGVYFTKTEIGGKIYGSITNVGKNPTFGCKTRTVETHLLDYSGNIYGRTIKVYFICKIREEKQFSNAEELKKQIAEDEKTARSMNDDCKLQNGEYGNLQYSE